MRNRHTLVLLCTILSVIFAGVSVTFTTARISEPNKTSSKEPPIALQGPPPALVETAQVKAILWQDKKNVVGTVKAVHYLDVSTEVSGTILQVAPAGSQMAKNGVLLRIDDRAERAQLKQKETNLAIVQKNAQRADLLVNKAISQAEQQAAHVNLAQAVSDQEVLRSRLRKMTITAPFAGVVSLHDLSLEQSIQVGQKIFSFYDPTKLYVEFSVPEADICALHPGVKVTVDDTVSGYTSSATITLVNTEVNTTNRTLTLRAMLDIGKFRHGSSVRVTYPTTMPQSRLVLPKVAVNYSAYGQSVFVVEDHTAKLRSIVIGDKRDGLVQVLQGLDANETVVTAGQIHLYPDAPLRLRDK
ncbi:efflux RND transporter periplasmic adaptor subunit [Providencia sp. PROV130]|uniref:efflux RND transporter periplasmic adaptor subunit n=1 Tax=Providencia sp. PROV130 TaxID=2949840 RepID=UPI00234B7848|nr:efflux RND transporter periplasmic adaptor subunit [Providencia sp. PROV130]